MTTFQTDDANSKYWEIQVDHTPPNENKINTYLRLGTAEPNPISSPEAADMTASETAQRGHDLAAMVSTFIDDERERGPHLPTPATREAETAKLHTKGGWRDHSDGNRISTTRGDKVEVIRGDYKLVVLGRQDDPLASAEWDASGGLIQDGDIAPGSVTSIKWEQDPFSGTWTVTEECAKGNTISKFHGNVEEHFFGETITTFVGSPASGPIVGWTDDDAPSQMQTNPVIVEKTWAESITEDTTVTGSVKETTIVGGSLIENTHVTGALNSNTTVVGAQIDTLAALFYLEASAVATAKIELETQLTHISVEVSPFMLDFFLGVTMDIRIGPVIEIEVGATYEINSSASGGLFIVKDEIGALETKIAGNTTAIEANTTAISTNTTSIAANTTAIDTNKTDIATNSTEITALKNLP